MTRRDLFNELAHTCETTGARAAVQLRWNIYEESLPRWTKVRLAGGSYQSKRCLLPMVGEQLDVQLSFCIVCETCEG
jgi:hypothetical protein